MGDAFPCGVAGPRDAPAIVLLHANGWSRAMWRSQIVALAGEFRVIAPDLPGHGALATVPFTLDAAARVVADAITAHAGGCAVVAGLSLGGYVAMVHAAEHPDQVAGLALSGCSVAFRGRTRLLTLLTGALYDRLYTQWWGRRLAAKQRSAAAATYSQAVIGAQLADGFYPRSWGRALREMARRDYRSLLRAYPGPVVILNGERDRYNRVAEDEQSIAAGHAPVVILRDAGHLANLDQPETFTTAVRIFAHQMAPPARMRPDGVA
jgi:pimeloyl-ACP methyl ester carboxylesterase